MYTYICIYQTAHVIQGLVNVTFWGFGTSFSTICWRLYPQYLGDVPLQHLPTPAIKYMCPIKSCLSWTWPISANLFFFVTYCSMVEGYSGNRCSHPQPISTNPGLHSSSSCNNHGNHGNLPFQQSTTMMVFTLKITTILQRKTPGFFSTTSPNQCRKMDGRPGQIEVRHR